LGRLARKKGRRKSDVVREALLALADKEAWSPEASRPYEALAHLIGTIRGGRPTLSARTGARFKKLLRRRRRA
jgi:Arc/MetJ-type ribon-helix-helix transcriptional regulator